MTGEQNICACGMPMTPTKLGSSYLICANCDVIQASEYTAGKSAGKRTKTPQDHRFNMEWNKRIRETYTEGGKAA